MRARISSVSEEDQTDCCVLAVVDAPQKYAGRLNGKILDKYVTAIWETVVLGCEICSTTERLTIWSKKLGHGSVAVTQMHFGEMSECRKRTLPTDVTSSSEDEDALQVGNLCHIVQPDHPDYQRLKDLHQRTVFGGQ